MSEIILKAKRNWKFNLFLVACATLVLGLPFVDFNSKSEASNPELGQGITVYPSNGQVAQNSENQQEFWLESGESNMEFDVTVTGPYTSVTASATGGATVTLTGSGGSFHASVDPNGSSGPITVTIYIDGHPCWSETFYPVGKRNQVKAFCTWNHNAGFDSEDQSDSVCASTGRPLKLKADKNDEFKIRLSVRLKEGADISKFSWRVRKIGGAKNGEEKIVAAGGFTDEDPVLELPLIEGCDLYVDDAQPIVFDKDSENDSEESADGYFRAELLCTETENSELEVISVINLVEVCSACQDGTCSDGELESIVFNLPLGPIANGDSAAGSLVYRSEDVVNQGRAGIRADISADYNVTTNATGQVETITGAYIAKITNTPQPADANAFTVTISSDPQNPSTTQFQTILYESYLDAGTPVFRVTDTYSGDAKITTWKKTSSDPEIWEMTSGNGLRREKLTYIDNDDKKRTERREVFEPANGAKVSDIITYEEKFPWGWNEVKRVIDPDGQALTTQTDYYEFGQPSGAGDSKAGHSFPKKITHYDGSVIIHNYTDTTHTITEAFAGTQGAKVTTVTSNANDDNEIIEVRINGTLVSKSEVIHGVNTTTNRQYTSANEWLDTITERYPYGQAFGGQIKKITNPNGTVVINEYSTSGSDKITTTYRGVPGGSNITEGTKTTSIVNSSGNFVSSITWAVGTGNGLVLDHRVAISYDSLGRPLSTGYFPDGSGGYAYTTSRVYGCCGILSETDRTGIKTHYAYDKLRRIIKTNRLGITTESRYLGLTTSTYRYPETGSVAEAGTPSGTAATEIARNVSNLSNTYIEQWNRTAKDGSLIKASERTVTYRNPAHTTPENLPIGIGKRMVDKVVQTADDNAQPQQTIELYIDGSTYQTSGDLSPHMRYAYAAGSSGYETTRSYVDENNLRESVTTKVDFAGRVISVSYMDGASSTTGYNAFGQMANSVDPDGVTTLYAYNPEGERTTSAIDLNGNGIIDYDTDQISFSETNPVSAHGESCLRTTSKVWQPSDNSSNGGTVLAYSDRAVNGLKIWVTSFPLLANPSDRTNEVITTIPVNPAGNTVVKSVEPDDSYTLSTTTAGLLTKTERFDASDNLITSTTIQTYDTYNRPTHIKDSRYAQATVISYVNAVTDAIVSNTDASGNITTFGYDMRNRRITVDAPNTTDASGGVLENITVTHYFADGSQKEITGDQTYRRSYTYDYADRQKTFTTYGSVPATTEWVYDTQRGWLTEKNYQGESGNGPSNTADFTYTSAGRLATRTWESGATTTYHFDTAGRKTKVTYSDGTPQVDYIHDRLSRPRFAIQGSQVNGTTVNVTEYTYRTDNLTLDQEITVEGSYDGTNPVNQYTSSQNFKRILDRSVDTRLRSTGWTVNTTEHDLAYTYRTNDSRLNTITSNGQTHTYGYHYSQSTPANPRTGSNVGMKQDYMVYSIAGPVHSVINSYEPNRNILINKENKAGTNIRSNYLYTTNSIGQRDSLVTSGNAFGTAPAYNWSYNAAGELVQVDDTSPLNNDRAYQFDGIGNREKTANGLLGSLPGINNYSSDALNRYTVTPSAQSLSYDLDGNMTSGPLPAYTGGNSTLSWDAENRLVSVTVNGVTTNYGYDHLHRRIRKTSAATTTRYLYDGWNLIAEYTGVTLAKTYAWGIDISGSMQGAGGVGGLLNVELHTGASTGVYYPTYDGNGNISEYLNSSGAVVAHYEYDAFGKEITAASQKGNQHGDFSHRFSTKPLDEETNLYYYGYRYYDSDLGRWINRDPIEEKGGYNLYNFVSNDSVNNSDELGLVIVTGEGKAYRSQSRSAFEKITGSKLKWVILDKKPKNTLFKQEKYWCLEPDGKKGGNELYKHIEGAMKKGKPWFILMGAADLKGDNRDFTRFAFSREGGDYRPVKIKLGIRSGVPIETGKKDKYGLPEYSTARVPDFAPTLWHELVSHSILQIEHPANRDNVYPYVRAKQIIEWSRKGSVSPLRKVPDKSIEVENEARKKLGVPLRRPQYLDAFDIPGKYFVKPPSNWDTMQKKLEKIDERYDYYKEKFDKH